MEADELAYVVLAATGGMRQQIKEVEAALKQLHSSDHVLWIFFDRDEILKFLNDFWECTNLLRLDIRFTREQQLNQLLLYKAEFQDRMDTLVRLSEHEMTGPGIKEEIQKFKQYWDNLKFPQEIQSDDSTERASQETSSEPGNEDANQQRINGVIGSD